jgi:hypothetical protein
MCREVAGTALDYPLLRLTVIAPTAIGLTSVDTGLMLCGHGGVEHRVFSSLRP